MASVTLKNIYKIYSGGVTAVTDFNLDIEDKEFIILVGPSAVSYTHLDVYKRQLLPTATGWYARVPSVCFLQRKREGFPPEESSRTVWPSGHR